MIPGAGTTGRSGDAGGIGSGRAGGIAGGGVGTSSIGTGAFSFAPGTSGVGTRMDADFQSASAAGASTTAGSFGSTGAITAGDSGSVALGDGRTDSTTFDGAGSGT